MINIPDPDALEQRIREWAALVAERASLPPGSAAEGFLLVETGS